MPTADYFSRPEDPHDLFLEDLLADEDLLARFPNHESIKITHRDDLGLGEPDFQTPRTNVYIVWDSDPRPYVVDDGLLADPDHIPLDTSMMLDLLLHYRASIIKALELLQREQPERDHQRAYMAVPVILDNLETINRHIEKSSAAKEPT